MFWFLSDGQALSGNLSFIWTGLVKKKHLLKYWTGLQWAGKNIWKKYYIVSRSGKLGKFMVSQGNLERTQKIKEKLGNLKIMATTAELQIRGGIDNSSEMIFLISQ